MCLAFKLKGCKRPHYDTWNQTVALGSKIEEDGKVLVMWDIFLYAVNVLLLLVDK